MATHSSVLAWRIPGTGEAWRAVIHGVTKSRTRLSDWTELKWKYMIQFLCLLVMKNINYMKTVKDNDGHFNPLNNHQKLSLLES